MTCILKDCSELLLWGKLTEGTKDMASLESGNEAPAVILAKDGIRLV